MNAAGNTCGADRTSAPAPSDGHGAQPLASGDRADDGHRVSSGGSDAASSFTSFSTSALAAPMAAGSVPKSHFYANVVSVGWLFKLGGRVKSWRRRWFALDAAMRSLSYYADADDATPKGTIRLDSATAMRLLSAPPPLALGSPAEQCFFFELCLPHRTYVIGAPTDAERQRCCDIIASYLPHGAVVAS